MNLCVNSNACTIFLSSIEFSNEAHISKLIFEYVDKCIKQVGPQNVIQVVIPQGLMWNLYVVMKIEVTK